MNTCVATCAICRAQLYLEVQPDMDWSAIVNGVRLVENDHLTAHPEAVVDRYWFRYFLDHLTPRERLLEAKDIYMRVRALEGDLDSRGVYTMDEVLGSAAVYGLWLDAAKCKRPDCLHVSPPVCADAASALPVGPPDPPRPCTR